MKHLCLIIAIAFLWSCKKQAGSLILPNIITTIAGTDSMGYNGDGIAATAARLGYVPNVAVDGSGNVYIADYTNNRIRKVGADGIISTIAGNGTIGYSGDGGDATAAQLKYPYGVAVDNSGNVFIADANYRIRKVSSDGMITTAVGSGVDGHSGDGGSATDALIYAPRGIAVDNDGNLYIAETGNNCIRKVTAAGIISTIAGVAGKSTFGYSGDGGPATAAQLYHPMSVAVDGGGNVYILDSRSERVRKVTPAGIISTIAGTGDYGYSGDGGPATAAQIGTPSGIAIDGNGNIYVADVRNTNIRKITPAGIISTIAGNGHKGFSGDGKQAMLAQFYEPNGLAVDVSGNIYIADMQRIRKISN